MCSAARCATPIASWLGINAATTPAWLYWPLQLVLIMPLYQVLLLLVGSLFGQFRFFWAFEKRMLARCGLSFAASGGGSEAATGAGGPVADTIDAGGDRHEPTEKQYAE